MSTRVDVRDIEDQAAASDDSERTLAPGSVIGPYTLLRPIGQGGMAQVWAAHLGGGRGFAKVVALKTILPDHAEDAEFVRMFLDEAHAAAAVHHPNVCEIYELGAHEQTLFIAMEWVAGASLAEILRPHGTRSPLEHGIAARVVADACAGLHAVHEARDPDGAPLNIVHRDASPHNILVSVGGHVKIADFGVAKARKQLHQRTETGQLKGKAAYIAPEAVSSNACDRRIDVFAMGCVLYEASVGPHPFKGKSEFLTLNRILRGEYDRPRDIHRDFPPGLQEIIGQALETTPGRRYQTADAMRLALEEWLATFSPIVTQANVARAVRQRVGDAVAARSDNIREAFRTVRTRKGDQPSMGVTPSLGTSARLVTSGLVRFEEPPSSTHASAVRDRRWRTTRLVWLFVALAACAALLAAVAGFTEGARLLR